jgi:hypothetical protein
MSDKQVVCPVNPGWLEKMLEILPPELWGKLAPYAACPQSREGKRVGTVIHPVVKHR